MTDICPEIIIRAAPPGEYNPSTLPLLPSSNTVNLPIKKIVCNKLEPVLLRLIVCKDTNSTGNPDDCPYPEHKNKEASKRVCNCSGNRMAQIYLRDEKNDSKTRSCVIVLIEGQYLSKTDELLKILLYTVTWLNIDQERPHFYFFHYGPPVVDLTVNDTCRIISKKIRETFKNYPKDEDICFGISVRRDSESLIIKSTKRFSFSAA